MIICPQCQSANREGSKFCNECGTKLPQENVVPAPLDTIPADAPGSDRPASAESPDWIHEPRQPGSPSIELAQSSAAPSAEHAAALSFEPTQVLPAAPIGKIGGEASGVPDWLDELRQSGSAPSAAAQNPAAPAAEHSEAVPFEAKPAAPAAPTGKASGEASEVPDWLREFRDVRLAPQPSASEPVEIPQVAAGQMPGWLSDLSTDPTSSERTPDAAVPSESSAVAHGEQTQAPDVSGEIPEWLKGLSLAQPVESAADPTRHDVGEELPARLQRAAIVDQPAAEPVPFSAPILPLGPPPAAAGTSAEGPMPGEIPAWVLEMRPGALSSVSGDMLETSGLLAGIRGALPVQSVVSMPHKVSGGPTVTAAVPVTGFAELHVPKPTPPQVPPPPPSKRRGGCSGRFGMPLLIVFVIALAFLPLPVVSDWRGAAIAAYQPSRDFYQTVNHVNGLQPDALALVAIDYGAGSRAELDPQAKAVLSHLFQNKQRIVTVSFVPEGGQLAQDLLLSRNPVNSQFTYPYVYGETHINLGYQSGGEASLRNLSQNPLSVLSLDYRDHKPVGNWPLTKGWKTLDDVGLIVVFSDDAAQVVRWIEQVGTRPDHSSRTLLAGVSKSSESILMPYYESKQLKGLLAGIHGAAEYEGFLLQPASAAATLDGISYVVIVLVLVFGLSILATAMIRRAS
jgi:hypothetical protein